MTEAVGGALIWEPLRRIEAESLSEDDVNLLIKKYSCSREDAVKVLTADKGAAEYWKNSTFQVVKYRLGDGWFRLCIERQDGQLVYRDWALFQKIKNQLLGPECEALELYPAETRKVDSANMYHLYGVADPKVSFSFGFTPVHNLDGRCYDVRGRSKPASYK